MKEIAWQGSSREDLIGFPVEARRMAGYQLDKVQHGELPDDWKAMPVIGAGVREIRIRESSGAYRVIYVASIGSTIHVLHAFQKKTQKARQSDVELARQRFRSIEIEYGH